MLERTVWELPPTIADGLPEETAFLDWTLVVNETLYRRMRWTSVTCTWITRPP